MVDPKGHGPLVHQGGRLGGIRDSLDGVGGQHAIAAAFVCLRALALVWLFDWAYVRSDVSLPNIAVFTAVLLASALLEIRMPAFISRRFRHVGRRNLVLAHVVFIVPVLAAYLLLYLPWTD